MHSTLMEALFQLLSHKENEVFYKRVSHIRALMESIVTEFEPEHGYQYTGETLDELLHGEGILQLKDGSTKEGFFWERFFC